VPSSSCHRQIDRPPNARAAATRPGHRGACLCPSRACLSRIQRRELRGLAQANRRIHRYHSAFARISIHQNHRTRGSASTSPGPTSSTTTPLLDNPQRNGLIKGDRPRTDTRWAGPRPAPRRRIRSRSPYVKESLDATSSRWRSARGPTTWMKSAVTSPRTVRLCRVSRSWASVIVVFKFGGAADRNTRAARRRWIGFDPLAARFLARS